jgi:hypothetical protein
MFILSSSFLPPNEVSDKINNFWFFRALLHESDISQLSSESFN